MATGTADLIDTRSGPDGPAPAASYRPDIDGLRAVSILLVVAFHAGVSAFAGGYVGVDVFFVISGFLITGLLLDEHDRNGRISMTRFYARRMRRLLPLSALVLGVTVLVGRALLAPIDHATLFWDARAAALYFANWRFAAQAGVYADTGPTDSLLVHYWSLSIEEQFYLVWPLLLLGAGMLARRRPSMVRPALGGILAVAGIASLIASIALTHTSPTMYYVTHVRVWELAAGAGLAMARPALRRIGPRVAGLAGVAGVACILLAAVTFGHDTVFPGTAALLPVAGSMLVLVAGFSRSARVPRLLASGPMPAIGRISYGWYLWHWPAIGIALLLVGNEASGAATVLATIAAVVASFLLALVSHRLVEQPVRTSPRLNRAPRVSIALGLVLTMVPLGLTVSAQRSMTPVSVPTEGALPGAAQPLRLAMTPEQARADKPKGVGKCHLGFPGDWVAQGCVFGDPAGDRTIALIGDSHAQHWFPVLDRLAGRRGWRLLVWTKSACPIVDVRVHNYRGVGEYTECTSWRHTLFDRLTSEPGSIDVVVVGRSRGYMGISIDERGRRVPREEIAPVWQRAASRSYDALLEASRRVLLIEDTPWAPHDIPACLSESPEDPAACGFEAARFTNLDGTLVGAERAAAVDGVSFADFTDDICPTTICPAVTPDGVVIYRDAHHMTATYNRTLVRRVGEVLAPLVARA